MQVNLLIKINMWIPEIIFILDQYLTVESLLFKNPVLFAR